MIKGKKVFLTAVEKENLEQLREWRNDPELRRYFREYKELSSEMQKRWYENRVLGDPDQVNFEIHDKDSKKLIGHCGLYYIEWMHQHAEFGIYIGEESFRSRGYGSDTLRTLVRYGFEQLNLNRIWCEVYDNNTSIEMYRHIGFKDEGILRQKVFKDGKYLDAYVLSMLREEYHNGKEG